MASRPKSRKKVPSLPKPTAPPQTPLSVPHALGPNGDGLVIRSLDDFQHALTRLGYAQVMEKQVGYADFMKSEILGRAGLTPDYSSFRNTYYGQLHPVAYKLFWKAFLEDPVVSGAVNVVVDAVARSWELKSETPLHKKRLEKILKANSWTQQLRAIVFDLMIYGDSYLELVRADARKRYMFEYDGEAKFGKAFDIDSGKVFSKESLYAEAWEREMLKPRGLVDKFFLTDAASVRIDYNEHGEVIKYIQRVRHRRVDFYPDEMVHLNVNRLGGRVYGHSQITPLLYTLQTKVNAENYTSDFFRRGAVPRVVYVVKKNFSKEQYDRMVDKLKTIAPWQDLVLVGEVDIKPIESYKMIDMQFAELLQYLRENISIALMVPLSLLGMPESANRSQGQVNLEAFGRRIAALQDTIADVLNSDLFNADNFGFDDVEFEFINDNPREELVKIQAAQLLSTMVGPGIVSVTEVRLRMGLDPIPGGDEFRDPLEQQMMLAQAKFGGKPGEQGQTPQNARSSSVANPTESAGRAENRERVNSDQAGYTAGRVAKDAYEQQMRAAMQNSQMRAPSYVPGSKPGPVVLLEAAAEAQARHQSSILDESDPRGREPRIMQGTSDVHADEEKWRHMTTASEVRSQSPHPIPPFPTEAVTTNVGEGLSGQRRYPYGATPLIPGDPKEWLAAKLEEQKRELESITNNPIGNAFDANTDREWPKPGKKPPKRGSRPPVFPRPQGGSERDEVNEAGTTVWAAPDKKSKGPEKAVFYKDTDQLAEEGIELTTVKGEDAK